MAIEDIFKSIVIASCGACLSDVLCENCLEATLRANGLPEVLVNDIRGFSKRENYGNKSNLHKKLNELRSLQEKMIGQPPRLLILNRLEELKREHKGFSRSLTRWKNFHVFNTPIQEVKFEELEDAELIFQFERVIKRHYTQM